jgi:hypothetical protein
MRNILGKLMVRALCAAVLAPLLCGCFLGTAGAAEIVKLKASLTPDRRGQSTTIVFGFSIGTADGSAPPGLRAVDLSVPSHMGLATSSLGLATCEATTLIRFGLLGCPVNARVGYGNAIVEVPLGPQLVREHTGISTLLGPSDGADLHLLFYANGLTPVFAQLVFPAKILPDSGRFGGRINTSVPVVPVLPEGANASLVQFSSTIGPKNLTYYRRVRGHRVPFHPRGGHVPKVCPKGGFLFSADFEFQDSSRATAKTHVPCPAH